MAQLKFDSLQKQIMAEGEQKESELPDAAFQRPLTKLQINQIIDKIAVYLAPKLLAATPEAQEEFKQAISPNDPSGFDKIIPLDVNQEDYFKIYLRKFIPIFQASHLGYSGFLLMVFYLEQYLAAGYALDNYNIQFLVPASLKLAESMLDCTMIMADYAYFGNIPNKLMTASRWYLFSALGYRLDYTMTTEEFKKYESKLGLDFSSQLEPSAEVRAAALQIIANCTQLKDIPAALACYPIIKANKNLNDQCVRDAVAALVSSLEGLEKAWRLGDLFEVLDALCDKNDFYYFYFRAFFNKKFNQLADAINDYSSALAILDRLVRQEPEIGYETSLLLKILGKVSVSTDWYKPLFHAWRATDCYLAQLHKDYLAQDLAFADTCSVAWTPKSKADLFEMKNWLQAKEAPALPSSPLSAASSAADLSSVSSQSSSASQSSVSQMQMWKSPQSAASNVSLPPTKDSGVDTNAIPDEPSTPGCWV